MLESSIDSIEGVALREKNPNSLSVIIKNKEEVQNNEAGAPQEGEGSTNNDGN